MLIFGDLQSTPRREPKEDLVSWVVDIGHGGFEAWGVVKAGRLPIPVAHIYYIALALPCQLSV
jgi:hypothetical protein